METVTLPQIWQDHRSALLRIFCVALVLRLFVFAAMLGQMDRDQMAGATPDAGRYVEAATHILEEGDFHTVGVNIFGPGYPLFLAGTGGLVTSHPAFLILVQIILSAVGSAAIAVLALQITGNRRVAWTAALLNALSLASVFLANVLLSDTLYFATTLVGMVLFIHALHKCSLAGYIAAGILLAAAALTRSVGMFVPLLLIVAGYCAWPRTRPPLPRKRILPALIPGFIVLIVVTGWALRPRAPEETAIPMAGAIGIQKAASLVRAEVEGISYSEAQTRFAAEVDSLRIAENRHVNRVFPAHARLTLMNLLLDHPATTTHVLLKNIRDNTNDPWNLGPIVLPQWKNEISNLARRMARTGLKYRVSLLALIGLIIMLVRRHYRPALVLTSVYVYYAALSGFSLWQGNRIFYPGQISWAILCAVTLVTGGEAGMRGVRQILGRRRRSA
ncbi:MAG: glycosyltransferase family 39 protein [candidate division Zixibacteria bacterium]|nr:glycosyltransferase family 39 protein [candidate division Zixibacteria bacterium]